MGNSRRARSEEGRRARIILDLGRGLSLRAVSAGRRSGVQNAPWLLWRDRFREDRLAGLSGRASGPSAHAGPREAGSTDHRLDLHRKTSGERPVEHPHSWPENWE